MNVYVVQQMGQVMAVTQTFALAIGQAQFFGVGDDNPIEFVNDTTWVDREGRVKITKHGVIGVTL